MLRQILPASGPGSRLRPLPGVVFATLLLAGCLAAASSEHAKDPCVKKPRKCTPDIWLEPHVLVAMSDSAINPYHEVYHRPERRQHPCTYVELYPCDVPALGLSIGLYEQVEDAVAADQAVWASMEPGGWYWIPRTNLIAVSCAGPEGYPEPDIPPRTPDPDRPCLMESYFPVGGESHGTETSSSIVMENPDVLLLFSRGTAYVGHIIESPFPVDLYSHSFAAFGAPQGALEMADCRGFVEGRFHDPSKLFVGGAGNTPTPTMADCLAGDPNIISVGGAYTHSRSEEATAAKGVDVVSYFCRPVAKWDTVHEFKNGCGTSVAAPTVAGALSKVLLDLRRTTGYTGGPLGDVLDPVAGLTRHDLRAALNMTASYQPAVNHTPPTCPTAPTCPNELPLLAIAPWLQWGWGFYDSTLSAATVGHLLGTAKGTHPADAAAWMQVQHDVKREAWYR